MGWKPDTRVSKLTKAGGIAANMPVIQAPSCLLIRFLLIPLHSLTFGNYLIGKREEFFSIPHDRHTTSATIIIMVLAFVRVGRSRLRNCRKKSMKFINSYARHKVIRNFRWGRSKTKAMFARVCRNDIGLDGK